MENSSNPYDELEPLFDGLPALARLITGEDIMCVILHRRPQGNEVDTRMFLERPLCVETSDAISEDAVPVKSPLRKAQTVYSTIQTKFTRWIPFTAATVFPVYADHILSIAPLAEEYINAYMNWADELYPPVKTEHSTELNERRALTDQTEEEIRRSYVDYLLHQFNPKGKPN